MESSKAHLLLLLLHLCTLALTATIPTSNALSLITVNNTLGLNTTLLSLSSGGPPPSDIPDPYIFEPQLPPSHGKPSLKIKIQGYGAADMDPQALLVAFNKAMVYAEHDHDLHDKITEKRLVYRSKGAILGFTPRHGITTWEDWDEAATGFHKFFLDRAIEQKDAFEFIFELIAEGVEGTLGFGFVKEVKRPAATVA